MPELYIMLGDCFSTVLRELRKFVLAQIRNQLQAVSSGKLIFFTLIDHFHIYIYIYIYIYHHHHHHYRFRVRFSMHARVGLFPMIPPLHASRFRASLAFKPLSFRSLFIHSIHVFLFLPLPVFPITSNF